VIEKNNEAYFNLGKALGNLAKTKTGEEAEKLYSQAIEKYSTAIEIKPNDGDAYFNWENYLGELTKTKTGPRWELFIRIG
jgi:tetratricopeptide (TPR) repeat protein